MIENEKIFKKTKDLHPFKMLNYLKENKDPSAEETIKENFDSMDPNLYLMNLKKI